MSERHEKLEQLAHRAARRTRRERAHWRQQSEAALAERFVHLLTTLLEAADSSSAEPVELYLDELLPAAASAGFGAADVLLILGQAEAALRDLVVEEEGGRKALGSKRWRAIQGALRHAERSLLRRADDAYKNEERRFAGVLEVLPDMVLLTDERQQVRFANRQVREILGLEPAAVLGRTFEELMALGIADRFVDPDAFVTGARKMIASPDRPHEDEVQRQDGRFIIRRSLPLHDDGQIGRVVIYSDVTRLRENEQRAEALLRQLIVAQEEERKRIASELHDGPVQVLSATILRLDSLLPKVATEGGKALADLRTTLDETRSLLFHLRPEVLDREGLAPAVRTLLELLAADTSVRVQLEQELTGRPPREIEVVAFRVLQEALTNVRKHARARSVIVRIEGGTPLLRVEVRDDGLGFDPKALEVHPDVGHVGLASMRERVELAGGKFELQSAPGKGARIRFSLSHGPA